MIKLHRSEITVAQVFEAYYDCRSRKRNTASALAFEVNLEANLMGLYRELVAGTWVPAPASVFVVQRPKCREVWAADFRDRIVHHLVYRAIGPLFERAFIGDSCACIEGRGTLFGADRLERHLLSATENWSKPAFVLKADIKNFFGSIDQSILFDLLAAKIRDQTMLDLCRKLVFQDVRRGATVRSTPAELALVPRHKSLFHAAPGIGLPIGNLSSQFFANVLLDRLDQMIKRRLGMRHYVRYVDDMVLIHPSAAVLLDAAQAMREHLAGLGLELAEHKTFVAPAAKGVDFVGHVIRPFRRSGRAKTHRAALRRIEDAAAAELGARVNSYLGLYRHAGSRAQIIDVGRAAMRRGLRLDRALTKVTSPRKPCRDCLNAAHPEAACTFGHHPERPCRRFERIPF